MTPCRCSIPHALRAASLGSAQRRSCHAGAGAVGCFILCAVLGLTEGLTLYVLSKFAERYDAVTYSLLVRTRGIHGAGLYAEPCHYDCQASRSLTCLAGRFMPQLHSLPHAVESGMVSSASLSQLRPCSCAGDSQETEGSTNRRVSCEFQWRTGWDLPQVVQQSAA